MLYVLSSGTKRSRFLANEKAKKQFLNDFTTSTKLRASTKNRSTTFHKTPQPNIKQSKTAPVNAKN